MRSTVTAERLGHIHATASAGHQSADNKEKKKQIAPRLGTISVRRLTNCGGLGMSEANFLAFSFFVS